MRNKTALILPAMSGLAVCIRLLTAVASQGSTKLGEAAFKPPQEAPAKLIDFGADLNF